MNWPEQKVVVRLQALFATKVRQAFKSAIDGDAIAQAWADTHPAGGQVSPQTARDWALAHAIANEKPLQHVLARLYADGYTLGAKVAKTRLNGLKKGASASVGVDWTNWKPGNESAAALVKPKGGLKQLLDSRKIIVANEITRTKLDRIGTALATSLSKGETTRETAKAINAIISDPRHALTIAQTEMSRAMSVASRDAYEKADVEQVEWLVAEGCEDCQDNADASPIGIDETFPSGDSEPPAHPNCMCALAPYYDYSPSDNVEDTDINLEDFASEAQSLAEDMIDEEFTVEELAPLDLSLNEPNIKNVTYDDALINKLFAETGVSNLSMREMNNLPQDVIAESISKIQGFNALPKVIEPSKFDDLVSKEGWKPIYRGIGGKTQAEVNAYVNEFKAAPVQFGGRGIYGSGTYVAESRGVAEHFAKANGAKNGEPHAFGQVMEMAINPKARIVDYDQIDKATMGQVEKLRRQTRALWAKENLKALQIVAKKEGINIKVDEYGRKVINTDKFIVRKTDDYGNERIDYDKSDFDSVQRIEKEIDALTKEFLAKTNFDQLSYLNDEALYVNVGNRAALAGVDVIRVPKPEYSRDDSGNLSDYYIVLNRGAIAVKQ